MKKFSIDIVSVSDRDRLVAEIWSGDDLIAEINQENQELEIALFSSRDTEKLSLKEFQAIIDQAAQKLIESGG